MKSKAYYSIVMQHDENTLISLSHMQYDLFCTRNRTARSLLSAVLIIASLMYGGGTWWSYLIIAYGCFLLTSTYASANRTAHKMADQIKAAGLPFPSSNYIFEDQAMRIITLPDREELPALSYGNVLQLGENMQAYYLFRDQYGGYMIPKAELGEQEEEFRTFVQEKTGKKFIRRLTPLRRLQSYLSERKQK